MHFKLTLEGLKVAAAIGTPRTVKVTNQSPPSRSKKGPGPSSPQEYRGPSFKDEYSFTYYRTRTTVSVNMSCIMRKGWFT